MTTPDKPQIDVSQRALSVARKIDRLPEGTWIIQLEKVNDRNAEWDYHELRVVGASETKIRAEAAPIPVVIELDTKTE